MREANRLTWRDKKVQKKKTGRCPFMAISTHMGRRNNHESLQQRAFEGHKWSRWGWEGWECGETAISRSRYVVCDLSHFVLIYRGLYIYIYMCVCVCAYLTNMTGVSFRIPRQKGGSKEAVGDGGRAGGCEKRWKRYRFPVRSDWWSRDRNIYLYGTGRWPFLYIWFSSTSLIDPLSHTLFFLSRSLPFSISIPFSLPCCTMFSLPCCTIFSSPHSHHYHHLLHTAQGVGCCRRHRLWWWASCDWSMLCIRL